MRRRGARIVQTVLATLALAMLPAESRAAPPAPTADLEAAALPETAAPRVCTPLGCVGAPSSPWTYAVSFAAAVLAAGWLGRRRRSQSGTPVE